MPGKFIHRFGAQQKVLHPSPPQGGGIVGPWFQGTGSGGAHAAQDTLLQIHMKH